MTTNEPDLPPLPPKWPDPGYLTREAEALGVQATADHLAALSRWIDDAPANAARDPEAVTWGRLSKVAEECGEVISAFIGATGQNPRKGVTHSLAHVRKELLDVAVTALGAVEHLDGNAGSAMAALDAHVAGVARRAGLSSVPASEKSEGAEAPEPPADLRDAIVVAMDRHEVVWVDHDTGWECGCNEHGDCVLMPTRADAVHHIADAVLPAVQAHVTAEVERARVEGAAEALKVVADHIEQVWKEADQPFREHELRAAATVGYLRQEGPLILAKYADRIAGGEQRG